MESQTQDVLNSVLGDEFKIEVEKRDKVIKQLNAQEEALKSRIASLEKEISELSAKQNTLNDEVINAYAQKESDFKAEKASFESSKENSITSLETREKRLDENEAILEGKIKSHQDNVQSLNKDKADFESKKAAIAEALEEASKTHIDLFNDAIGALKGS